MPKTKLAKKQKPTEFDFMDYSEEISEDEAMLGMMTGFVEASRYQQQHSLELTKLIIEKSKNASPSEEEIYSIFKRASCVISESTPLNKILEKI